MSFVANRSRPDVPITNPRSRSHPLWTPPPPPLKEERILTMIDPMTQHVQKLLRQTLCKRFYNRYHPINALKYSNMFYCVHIIDGEAVGYLDCFSIYVDNVKFLYVIDMQVVLFLGPHNGELIDNMVRRTPLYEECPKHHGHKGDPGVTPGTCGAIGERAQVILVWVRARALETPPTHGD